MGLQYTGYWLEDLKFITSTVNLFVDKQKKRGFGYRGFEHHKIT